MSHINNYFFSVINSRVCLILILSAVLFAFFLCFIFSPLSGVRDRWSARGSQTSRGDNLYRPYSVAEQNTINLRVERRKLARGDPRRGEW